MGENIKKRQALWMRYVHFDKVKDILLLVAENNDVLRAGELERLAIEKGILIKEDGSPLTHSPRYHYRKVMEHLGLISKLNSKGCYSVVQESRVGSLLHLIEFGKPLSEEAKEIVADIVVSNNDCRKYFFDAFMSEDTYDLAGLRKGGDWIIVRTMGKEGTILQNPHTNNIVHLKTKDHFNAIFWGVRLWALELAITDEIFISYKEGRIIYPTIKNVRRSEIIKQTMELVAREHFNGDWITVHIPDLIKKVALTLKVPVKEVKDVLWDVERQFPQSVILVPSSSSFIDIKTPFSKQDRVLFRAYLKDGVGRYISHLKIHVDLFDKLKEGAYYG